MPICGLFSDRKSWLFFRNIRPPKSDSGESKNNDDDDGVVVVELQKLKCFLRTMSTTTTGRAWKFAENKIWRNETKYKPINKNQSKLER